MSAMNSLKKTSGWLNRVLWSFAACLLTLSPVAHGVETVTYYHLDALGSTVAATDDGGNVLWREAYKPYGERINGQDEAGWYTGKAYDEDIGLNYFGARWYHPELGRFMADDPVGFDESNPQSFNRYAYANNNPYRYVDPDGRASQAAGATFYAIFLGATACSLTPGCTQKMVENTGAIVKSLRGFFNESSEEGSDSNSGGTGSVEDLLKDTVPIRDNKKSPKSDERQDLNGGASRGQIKNSTKHVRKMLKTEGMGCVQVS